MISGYLGNLIAVERMVALRKPWMYLIGMFENPVWHAWSDALLPYANFSGSEPAEFTESNAIPRSRILRRMPCSAA